MSYNRIIITGGAGFVGSNLAVKLKAAFLDCDVLALDNLYRKGSEKILPRLENAGVTFLKGDVRDREFMLDLPSFDLMIECSAEPSVKAGYDESPFYLLDTNLGGAINCAEACKRHKAKMVFISTSRVYGIEALRDLSLIETESRLACDEQINLDFSTSGHRSLYGSSKLSAELLLQEYHYTYDLPIHIVRCGVIAGPWQMGKVDQGFVSLWCAAYLKGRSLQYIGFGGLGKQVRDVLHVDDLFAYLKTILSKTELFNAQPLLIGGGLENSISLGELNDLCAEISGKEIEIRRIKETHPSDIPYFVVNNLETQQKVNWSPKKSVKDTVVDTMNWLQEYPEFLS